MKTLSLIILMFLGFFIRWARWLAIVQQKEYRWDRLLLFLESSEGKRDFWRLIPHKQDFTRTGLKRPVKTARVLLVGLISLGILVVGSWLLQLLPIFGTWGQIILAVIYILLAYFILPIVVIVATLPSTIISMVVTYLELTKAQKKVFSSKPLIIGITGSYGKTTTKMLVAHVLSTKFQVFYTPKSFNTRYSVAKSINDSYQGEEIAVLEYGAYTKGEIAALTKWFPPQMAIITGVTFQHVGLFGSLEEIITAKSELVKALPENASVFCNGADQGAVSICDVRPDKNLILYAGNKTSVLLKNLSLNKQAQLKFSWKGKTVQTQLVGLHYSQAVQAAIAVAVELGVEAEEIVAALETFESPSNFIKVRTGLHGAQVIDDGGTSNKQGFEAALAILDWYKKQRYQTVLVTAGIVDLGEWSDQIHEDLAQQSNKIADQVFHLGTDGRTIFSAELGQKLGTNRNDLESFLAKINNKTAILLEGRLPQWAVRFLK